MVGIVLRLRVAALCIVYPIHDSRPAGPFGKAAVREVDGEKAEPDLSNENDQRNYLKSPKVKKRPKYRGFCGSISERANLSEFIRIPGPLPNGRQSTPQ
jgi:hypothetical protein